MKISSIIWVNLVIEKIESKHNVSPAEVEQVLGNKPHIRKMIKGRFQNEFVYRAMGQTDTGRHLTIFFILKQPKSALILSARAMDKKERRSYAKR